MIWLALSFFLLFLGNGLFAPHFTAAMMGGSQSSWISALCETAAELAGSYVGTEHLLLALLQDPASQETLVALGVPRDAAIADIRALPWVSANAEGDGNTKQSPAVKAAVELAQTIAEADGKDEPEPWHLVLALLGIPKSIGRSLLMDHKPGLARAILKHGGHTAEFLQGIEGPTPQPAQNMRVVSTDDDGGRAHVEDSTAAAAAHLPQPLPRPATSWCRGPTSESNWLLPKHIMTGQSPTWEYGFKAQQKHVDAILAAGATTFVCLLEYEPEYMPHILASPARHVNAAAAAANQEGGGDGGSGGGDQKKRTVEVVWFPIVDFSIARTAHLEGLVEELARRVKRGEVLYVKATGFLCGCFCASARLT